MESSTSKFECSVCNERFDPVAHRPKLLHCGHTHCVACIVRVHLAAGPAADNAFQCPTCRRETRSLPEDLSDNFDRLELMESAAREMAGPTAPVATDVPSEAAALPQFWCLDDDAVANKECLARHAVKSLTAHREEQVKPTLDQLEAAVCQLRRLADEMAGLATAAQAAALQQEAEVARAVEAARRALSQLRSGMGLVGEEWDNVAAAAEAARSESADRMAADADALLLLDSALGCRLTVLGGDDKYWLGEVSLRADGGRHAKALLSVLLALRRAGGLLPSEDAVPPPRAAPRVTADAPQGQAQEGR